MLDKQAVLGMIQQQAGNNPQLVQQAEQELPDQVHPEQHADLLQKFGVDPQQALNQLGGGSGMPPTGGAESGL